jgi:hypothetical protein
MDVDVDLTADIASGDLDAGITPAVQAPAGSIPAHGTDTVQQNAQPTRTDRQTRQDGDKPLSLRDQLTAQFKGEETPAAVTDAPAGDTRPRNADGTFKSAEQIAADAAAAQTQQPGQQPAAVQAPQGVDPAVFAALPPETQQQVARTMATVEEQAARFRGYEGLEQVIGTRRQAWAMQGMSEAQAVNQLLALSDFAGQNPAEFVRWFSGQHGIDLTALNDAGGGDDQYIDPAVQELRQQVADLTGHITGQQQQQQAAQHQSLVNLTAQFAAETGTDGQPLRPYFAELGGGVLPYIQQVRAENPAASPTEVLAAAYDRACWATPSVRTRMLAAQEATRLAEQRAAAVAARNAGSSIHGQAPSAGSTQPKDIGSGSVRDTLRAAISQHS